MELNFEGLEMQKWNVSTDRGWRVDKKNGVIFFSCRVYSRIYGHLNVRNSSFFVSSAADTKKSVAI